MRYLFFGDVVGRPGRTALCAQLPQIKAQMGADAVIVNAENAAGGVGLTAKIADEIFAAGADCITLGNHAWDQGEMRKHIQRDPRIVRAANMAESEPGLGVYDFQLGDKLRVSVIQALGRVFMAPGVSNPLLAVQALLDEGRQVGPGQVTVVDFHAEASSEKNIMGHFLDGKVTSVTGTHTHAPTADTWIMPGGTAYQGDLGMCGDYNSVIGAQAELLMPFYLDESPRMKFEVAMGEPTLCGICVDACERTGLATRAQPFRIGGVLGQTLASAADQ